VPARARVLVPFGASQDAAAALRSRGFATVAALAPVTDEDAEARRLECSHVLRGGEVVALAGAT
jgi:ATP phosphoribosyltransferase regulatory subunit